MVVPGGKSNTGNRFEIVICAWNLKQKKRHITQSPLHPLPLLVVTYSFNSARLSIAKFTMGNSSYSLNRILSTLHDYLWRFAYCYEWTIVLYQVEYFIKNGLARNFSYIWNGISSKLTCLLITMLTFANWYNNLIGPFLEKLT